MPPCLASNSHFRAFANSIIFVSFGVVSVTTFLHLVGHRVQLFSQRDLLKWFTTDRGW